MWNFSFRVRKQKIDRYGLAPIELTININSKRSVIQLPMKVQPDEFNRLRASKRANYINTYCEQERVKVYRTVTQLQTMGYEVTTEAVKNILRNGYTACSYRISDLRDDYIKILRKRVGVDLTEGVFKKYERVMQRAIDHLQNKECKNITNADMKSLATEMRSTLQESTFANQWVIAKTFFTFGIHNKHIADTNLFATIKVSKKAKAVDYLTVEEVEQIRSAEYSKEALRRVADFAILEINLGLAYCDLVSIKKEDIIEEGNMRYIKKNRMKTNAEYISIITDEALHILEKYDYDISISNQCYNRFLKQVGKEAGIEKKLHSHLFRHTFAHHQLNERHLNLATVSKLLGHTNLKQTQHYCQKHTSTILEEFALANSI